MSRKAFTDDEFSGSNTLRNVSANLQTIKRMMGWGTTEMSNKVGISDRHLDSLLRMTSNVTVLVLEKIADSLGIPFQRLTGTRIKVREHTAGANFLEELQKESWHISSEELNETSVVAPLQTRRDAPARKEAKDTKVKAIVSSKEMDSLIGRIVEVQERLARDQSKLDSKVDELSDQVRNLASAVKQGGVTAVAVSEEASSKREAKGTRKGRAEPDGDLFGRGAPESRKPRGRAVTKQDGSRKARSSGGTESVEPEPGSKGPTPAKRPYNRKK